MPASRQFGRAAAVCLFCRLCFFVLPLCFAASLAHAQNSTPQEFQHKAHFLANIPSFVEWPESAFTSPQAPVTICVLGESQLVFVLAETTRGMTLHGRSVEIRWAAKEGQLRGCQIIFVSRSQSRRYAQILNNISRGGVLTVGESPDFLNAGGIVTLDFQNQTLQFEVNLQAAEIASLKISSRLLALARRVLAKNEGAKS